MFRQPSVGGPIEVGRGGLTETNDAPEADHDFLPADGVFPQDIVEAWGEFKRDEPAQIKQRPHAHEYLLHHDL